MTPARPHDAPDMKPNEPQAIALYMWDGSGLNVLIPKRRDAGYLRVPYGHHAIKGLDDIGAALGVDLCGLDGYLCLEYGHTSRESQAAIAARALPMLAAHYRFAEWREDKAAFWAVLLP